MPFPSSSTTVEPPPPPTPMPGGSGSESNPDEPTQPANFLVETTKDALILLEAARQGVIPRTTRRLVEAERQAMIRSGAVFVFDEEESGIRRWTDGLSWSPSRIMGNFLIYREVDPRVRRKGTSKKRSSVGESPQTTVPVSAHSQMTYPQPGSTSGSHGRDSGGRSESSSFADGGSSEGGDDEPESSTAPYDQAGSAERIRERQLLGSFTHDSHQWKVDGLIKKTISVVLKGTTQHLVSYYLLNDATSGRLRQPSTLPELSSLEIGREYIENVHIRYPVKTEIGSDGVLKCLDGPDEDISPKQKSLAQSGPPPSSTRSRRGSRAAGSTLGHSNLASRRPSFAQRNQLQIPAPLSPHAQTQVVINGGAGPLDSPASLHSPHSSHLIDPFNNQASSSSPPTSATSATSATGPISRPSYPSIPISTQPLPQSLSHPLGRPSTATEQPVSIAGNRTSPNQELDYRGLPHYGNSVPSQGLRGLASSRGSRMFHPYAGGEPSGITGSGQDLPGPSRRASVPNLRMSSHHLGRVTAHPPSPFGDPSVQLRSFSGDYAYGPPPPNTTWSYFPSSGASHHLEREGLMRQTTELQEFSPQPYHSAPTQPPSLSQGWSESPSHLASFDHIPSSSHYVYYPGQVSPYEARRGGPPSAPLPLPSSAAAAANDAYFAQGGGGHHPPAPEPWYFSTGDQSGSGRGEYQEHSSSSANPPPPTPPLMAQHSAATTYASIPTPNSPFAALTMYAPMHEEPGPADFGMAPRAADGRVGGPSGTDGYEPLLPREVTQHALRLEGEQLWPSSGTAVGSTSSAGEVRLGGRGSQQGSMVADGEQTQYRKPSHMVGEEEEEENEVTFGW